MRLLSLLYEVTFIKIRTVFRGRKWIRLAHAHMRPAVVKIRLRMMMMMMIEIETIIKRLEIQILVYRSHR